MEREKGGMKRTEKEWWWGLARVEAWVQCSAEHWETARALFSRALPWNDTVGGSHELRKISEMLRGEDDAMWLGPWRSRLWMNEGCWSLLRERNANIYQSKWRREEWLVNNNKERSSYSKKNSQFTELYLYLLAGCIPFMYVAYCRFFSLSLLQVPTMSLIVQAPSSSYLYI